MLPNRLGLTFDWRNASVRRIGELARAAETLGFGHLWIPEAWSTEFFSSASHAVSVTKSITVNAGIVNVYSRSAALIAMGVATLCELAPGRIGLGLGASGRGVVERWHGAKFERPLERTKEYVKVIRSVLNGGMLEHSGLAGELHGFRLFAATPKQMPPIYLGALGRRNLELAGEIADGAILTLYPRSKLRAARDALQLRASSSRRLYAVYPIATGGRSDARSVNELKRWISFYVASMGSYYRRLLIGAGYEKEVQRILDYKSRNMREESVNAVTEDMLDELVLRGSLENVVERINSLSKECEVVLGLFGGIDPADTELIARLHEVVRALETSNS